MKFTASKKKINEALKVVLKACPPKAAVPILSGIYLKAENSVLELQATDSTISLISKIPANVEDGGVVVVVGKHFAEICAKLPGDTITFETVDNLLEIKSETTTFSVSTFSADDFPTSQVADLKNYFSFTEIQFALAVKKIAGSASVTDDRPLFGCVNFQFTKETETLRIAATNTHRLAMDSITFPTPQPFDDFEFNVPAKKLLDVAGVIPQTVGGILHFGFFENSFSENGFSKKYCLIKFANCFASIRLVEGQFPPYERVIPQESSTVATIDTEKFKSALGRVNVFAKLNEHGTVVLNFDNSENTLDGDGILTISASSADGNAEESFVVKMTGKNIRIAFNSNYLSEALRTFDTISCIMKLSGELKPIDFREFEKSKFLHVITPVRQQSLK